MQMIRRYYPDTDTLSIRLKDASSVNTKEIANDVVVDFDADGNVISIDIDLASKKLNLQTLEMVDFPGYLTETTSNLGDAYRTVPPRSIHPLPPPLTEIVADEK